MSSALAIPTRNMTLAQRFLSVDHPSASQGSSLARTASALAGEGLTFGSFAEFVGTVIRNDRDDPRATFDDFSSGMYAGPTTVGSQLSGQDGGFLSPPQFAPEVLSKLYAHDSLMMRCDVRTTKTGSLYLPLDKTAPWPQNVGVAAYWAREASDVSALQSKLLVGGLTLRCNKLVCFIPLSDEMAADSVAAAEHISAVGPGKLAYMAERAIIAGTGAGTPLGIINSKSCITVAKDAGQTAGTVSATNILGLWKSLTPAARLNAVFLCHPDVDYFAQSMTFPTGTGAAHVYAPPSESAPYGSLLGRPIVPSEACSAPGNLGDVLAADLTAYVCATMATRFAASTHYWFDRDVQAMRITMRLDGAPWSEQTWASPNGSTNRSFFAAIQQR